MKPTQQVFTFQPMPQQCSKRGVGSFAHHPARTAPEAPRDRQTAPRAGDWVTQALRSEVVRIWLR
jgi:hypothetical protein